MRLDIHLQREIARLHFCAQQPSSTSIAAAVGVSPSTVARFRGVLKSKALTWAALKQLNDNAWCNALQTRARERSTHTKLLDESTIQIQALTRRETLDEIEHYRFGGLKGLRRHGHFKDVRVADPFLDKILHFPSPLFADNWLTSCFGRSLRCTIPVEPLYALYRGKRIKTRCALVIQTSKGRVADFVVRSSDEAQQEWQEFQLIVQAHGLIPQLRTLNEIRSGKYRLPNLEKMRQHLVQYREDFRLGTATRQVKRFLHATKATTLGALCDALENDLQREASEVAVISLYRLGALKLNISEAAYGNQTEIQLL